ncbi:hypothetical protein K435DRAFT_848457 [Dendrothele bispora CBS 962.96]|uniref:Uncharacterized protein n=1 Tax=Dendrothele bispora (strain CBS 962.96) TaxID=1314807 RepID=A0A4S8MUZ9_DENBC|nr:hypothetical protein K435DRAFT_848457 [Dendrothele bispora CBS 962.96]
MDQTNTAPPDDDHRRQPTPAPPRESISRASSRNSNVSNVSRSAYPGVPEELLEQLDRAREDREIARTNWMNACANTDASREELDALDRAQEETLRMSAPTPLRAVSEQPEILTGSGEDPRDTPEDDERPRSAPRTTRMRDRSTTMRSAEGEREGNTSTHQTPARHDEQNRSRLFAVPSNREQNRSSDNSSALVLEGPHERTIFLAMEQLGQGRGESETQEQYQTRMRAFECQRRASSRGVYRHPNARDRQATVEDGSADADNEKEAPDLVPPNVTVRRGRAQRASVMDDPDEPDIFGMRGSRTTPTTQANWTRRVNQTQPVGGNTPPTINHATKPPTPKPSSPASFPETTSTRGSYVNVHPPVFSAFDTVPLNYRGVAQFIHDANQDHRGRETPPHIHRAFVPQVDTINTRHTINEYAPDVDPLYTGIQPQTSRRNRVGWSQDRTQSEPRDRSGHNNGRGSSRRPPNGGGGDDPSDSGDNDDNHGNNDHYRPGEGWKWRGQSDRRSEPHRGSHGGGPPGGGPPDDGDDDGDYDNRPRDDRRNCQDLDSTSRE